MNLDPSEKRSVWWKGAVKGALKSALIGFGIGIGVALCLQFAVVPALGLLAPSYAPAIAGVFTNLLTLTPAAAVAGVVPTAAFSVVPFAIFSSVFSGVSGLFTGGSQAVAAYHQQKHNMRDEQKLMELDGRTRALEHFVTPGRITQAILTNGPRQKTSFAEAETARSEAPAQSPTIH